MNALHTALLLTMIAGATVAHAQQDKSYTVSVDVQLVELPVSVLGRDGRPISGLEKEHFQVFEDGVPQEISFFKHEDVPISVGLVIDNSGSMRNKRRRVNDAALTFVRESNLEDETFIVGFGDSAYLEQDFTATTSDLVTTLSRLDSRGETALYDAIFLSAEHLNDGINDRKALLLISDGEDNTSTYRLDKAISKLRESGATVYAIGLLDKYGPAGGLFGLLSSGKARHVLEKVAETTGGKAYFPKSADEIGELCRRIAHDLRNHYSLGYKPSNKKLDGSWRKITVRLNPPKGVPKFTVGAKEGYYAPKAQSKAEFTDNALLKR